MNFCGTYDKTIRRDELTGRTVFTVKTDDDHVQLSSYGNVLCVGVIPIYPQFMPLALEGEMKNGGTDKAVFRVSGCREHSDSREDAIAFLSSREFCGVGEKTAERIVDAIGDDLFSCEDYGSAMEKMIRNGVSSDIASDVTESLKSARNMHGLLTMVSACGGTYQDAYAVYKHYKSESQNVLKTNPYCALKYGLAYSTCEALAKKAGISMYDEERLSALVAESFRLSEASGDTAMTFERLCHLAHAVEQHANMGYHTESFYLGAAVILGEDKYVLYQDGDAWYIARRPTFESEQSITAHIHWLADRGRVTPLDPALIREIEEEHHISYADEQRDAFNLLSYPGVKVLTGGPGTGKSTVIEGLIAYYRTLHPSGAIRLCAPTANAAKRMREVTGEPASTVHKLLGLNLYGDIIASSRKAEGLPMGLIIVDEASMIDTDLFSALLRCLSSGSILLLVGDEDQLESVGPGDVLSDLISHADVPLCRLKKVYRQDNTSSLFDNSVKIRRGDDNLLEDDQTEIITVKDGKDMQTAAVKLMKRYYDPNDPKRCRLYTPVKNASYKYGTIQLNSMLQKVFNPSEDGVIYGKYTFKVGDPVQFLRNNYEVGYINGDFGVVRELIKGIYGSGIRVQLEDKVLDISGSTLEDVELAYALTVHKAQGSECERSIVLVPKAPRGMLYRRIVYVASTRARKNNVIVTEGDALSAAIRNTGYRARITGLRHILKKSLGLSEK